jgi:hypothetical protein
MDRLQQDNVFASPAHRSCPQTEAPEQLIDMLERGLRKVPRLSRKVSPIIEITHEALAAFGRVRGTQGLIAITGYVARCLRVEPCQLTSSSVSEKNKGDNTVLHLAFETDEKERLCAGELFWHEPESYY